MPGGGVNLGQPGLCNPYTTQYGYLTENMLQVSRGLLRVRRAADDTSVLSRKSYYTISGNAFPWHLWGH